jgi:hypothetical protein
MYPTYTPAEAVHASALVKGDRISVPMTPGFVAVESVELILGGSTVHYRATTTFNTPAFGAIFVPTGSTVKVYA